MASSSELSDHQKALSLGPLPAAARGHHAYMCSVKTTDHPALALLSPGPWSHSLRGLNSTVLTVLEAGRPDQGASPSGFWRSLLLTWWPLSPHMVGRLRDQVSP